MSRIASLRIPALDSGEIEQKREEIRRYFHASWDLYEQLFTVLKDDSVFYQRPEPLRHPLIFYFGHTATFYINKLIVSKIIEQRLDAELESMLAIGVDEMSWDDLNESHYDWPAVQRVRDYRAQVRQLVDGLISQLPLSLPIQWQDPFWIILMGIEHERIHLETSSVLIRQLPLQAVWPHPAWTICSSTGKAPENQLIEVASGAVKQGREQPAVTYGWDNEYGALITEVPSFKAGKFLVSNQEFLAFIEDGGYQSESWWTEEGWQWRQYKAATHPVFWVKQGDTYRYRSMLQEIDMPWDWPVDVNYLEAKAFCNWLTARTGKPIRLPTEAEWYRLYDSQVQQDQLAWTEAPGNINLEYWASSCPVNQFRQGDFYDVLGNVWQWTETAIDGFAGFQVHPAYDDFSVPTFDSKHNLIKGGSWISTGNEATRDSRYAFRRHFFQHAGFRYVESSEAITQTFNSYETDEFISQYLEFHYGDNYFGVNNYPQACIATILKFAQGMPFTKALDVGCAVGRSSFELAKTIPHVDALDFSTRFIRNALNLRQHGQLRYLIKQEGELTILRQANLAALDLEATADRVNFSQGDACNLKPIYQDYDLVFAGNLIDRLYQPAKFLSTIHERIKPGGLLALTSPYTWLEEYTEKQHWIGGYKESGENLTTLDGLHRILKTHFEPFGEPQDIPFVIRETARKYQHSIAQLTLWKRRA
ncbi:MAG: 5-histidylcysteine sulfoxide synthase [Thiofilum sp.]|uniref:5-histidylcysteine sulfoxide synthase n=1 Tax=Thiofilum sp. TaxID=2212733 RepID=UPI0025E02F91|nr:5-histidylcysteine sulfoxide synthase [Thiofilum sp.]MBK8454476.1 5-histidylcysteine sulfoxide synthase [Thiofilum sp.]